MSSITRSLRYLAALLITWPVLAVVRFVVGPWTAGLLTTVLLIVLTSLLLWWAFSAIRNGSRTARILLTILAVSQIVSIFLLVLVRYVNHPILVAVALMELGVHAATVVLVISDPIKSIPVPKVERFEMPSPFPHEHAWRPHSLMSDWLYCPVCKNLKFEAGTVADVNRKEPPAQDPSV
jgi:magnesium-transporting ATPase (P-type)